MSKAFLRESDFDSLPDLPPPASLLPPGSKNYLTSGGARRLRRELERLIDADRPPLAAAAPSDIDAKRELQALDQRIRYLQQSLRTAEVVASTADDTDVVRFGATVTLRDADGEVSTYRLVGVDETDLDRGWVSWRSPLAQALLNARMGQRVPFQSPAGTRLLEVMGISYEDVE